MAEPAEIGARTARAVAAAALGRRGAAAFAYWDAAADARFAAEIRDAAASHVGRGGYSLYGAAVRIVMGRQVARHSESAEAMRRDLASRAHASIHDISVAGRRDVGGPPGFLIARIAALLGAPSVWRSGVRAIVRLAPPMRWSPRGYRGQLGSVIRELAALECVGRRLGFEVAALVETLRRYLATDEGRRLCRGNAAAP